ncbi:MAG TPA: hypothetical protein VM733_12770 [Thermoanaerobaculia bacterium]|nr:hypothetical protein [Thermoanaerobaculia bacterium]
MPKVRDLGVNAIPGTHYIACAGTSNCINCVCNNTDIPPTSCDPSGCPQASKRQDKDKSRKKSAPLSVHALVLQQQLRARIAEPRSY